MLKNICFISIFDLTEVFYEQAIRLTVRGHSCYWMSTNPRWTQWLIGKGVARENILELVFEESDFFNNEMKDSIIEEVAKAELMCNRTVNMALIADRFIFAANKPNINDYICLYYHYIKQFLREKAIDIVFGEPTNVNEMITILICQELKIPFLYPQNLRIPSDRFFFELGVASGVMVSGKNKKSNNLGESILKEFRAKSVHPNYFYLNNQKSINFKKLILTLVNRSRDALVKKRTLTHHNFIDQLKVKLCSYFNGLYINYIYRYDELDQVTNKIAFFGLHVQPEASIDVFAPYFSDQLKLIKDMRRALPFNTTLIIKEHPNFLGKKPISFFRELRSIPNVRIIHPKTSTFDIYKRANLVLTVSGTTAYEAGILGIPAVSFSQMFFLGLSSIHYCPDIIHLKSLSMSLLSTPSVDYGADVNFMNSLVEKSYQGNWTDPLSYPSVMARSNLDALFEGFLDVVENSVIQK